MRKMSTGESEKGRYFPNLSDERLLIRIGYGFLFFAIILVLGFIVGFLVLPEGILRGIPLPSLILLGTSDSLLITIIKTFVINTLFVLVPLIVLNHLRVRTFTFGYLYLFSQTFVMGLFAGTNSFGGGISAYTVEGWLLFFQIGFVEFSSYILFCVATVNLVMFHANRWRHEQFQRIRNFRDFQLSKSEILLLLIALGLLGLAAFNEWRYLIFS